MLLISIISFNSIKVRLIFHYDTLSAAEKQFQFHKGSINIINWINVCNVYNCFNSIKVRLIFVYPLLICKYTKSFNSIKVRLICCAFAYFVRTCKFQFHKGSINIALQTCILFHDASFNSIKVRLICVKDTLIEAVKRFQFHKGSINIHKRR